MLRVRIAFLAIGLLVYLAVVFYPATLAYTMWLGEPAVATVTECHPRGKNQNCRATWVGADGRSHSAQIDGVYSDDVGEQVGIRTGPFGARKDGPVSKVVDLALLIVFGLVAPVAGVLAARRMTRRVQAGGDQLMASPIPEGATRLFATHKRIWRPDGREVAVLRPADAPIMFREVSPPGRIPHQRSGSILEAARWLAYNPSKGAQFVGVYNTSGVPMFLIHRPRAGSYAPETTVVDPGGATRVVIRRMAELPARYALLAPDGRDLGSIAQVDRRRPVYLVRDEHGREVGTLAIHSGRWVVQFEDGTPLRDPALAFAADAYRLRT